MLVEVACFSFPYEAHIARAKLESEKVPAVIMDEHTINMQWLYSNALGGVKVLTSEIYMEKARAILKDDCSDVLVAQQGEDKLFCKFCGSPKIERQIKGRRIAFLVFIVLQFPLWPFKQVIKCYDCGKAYKQK